MIILIVGWSRLGKPLDMYKVDMSVSEHKTVDDIVGAYRRMHPSAIRITMDVSALPVEYPPFPEVPYV